MKKMDRKTFIQKTAGVLLITSPVYALLNCSSDDSDQATGRITDCIANGTVTSIGDNHGHILTVSAEDVSAGVAKTYEIQGAGSHPHQVTISAAQFAELTNNGFSINEISTSNDGHTHLVSVACA